MNISPDIKDKAYDILNQPNVVLPVGIKIGNADPVYFIGSINDSNINTHLTIEHGGVVYKIGTMK